MANKRVSVDECEEVSRPAYWGRHLAACEALGVSMARYCRERGLSYSGLQWWKQELKRRAGAARASERPAFAEVRVAAAPEALIEIGCGGSRRIGVHPGFDEETLVRVLAALERGAC